MIRTRVRTALVAAGIIAPFCEGFYGVSPAEDGIKTFETFENIAAANVAFYSKALAKAIAKNDDAKVSEVYAALQIADANVAYLQDQKMRFPFIVAEFY